MTVYEFFEYCASLFVMIEIYSTSRKRTVFCGTMFEMEHSEYYDSEMTSFEVDGDKLIINIK